MIAVICGSIVFIVGLAAGSLIVAVCGLLLAALGAWTEIYA